MKKLAISLMVIGLSVASTLPAFGAVAGKTGGDDLVITRAGATSAVVVVSPNAGPCEKRAAANLVGYITLISGVAPKLVDQDAAIPAAMGAKSPVFVVGRLALEADPSLSKALGKVAKATPLIRSDAIVIRHAGNRVYLVGSNDESHYYAMVELLERWGCRWYLPTAIGECVPSDPELKVGEIDYAYACPFEVRRYWLSWLGDGTGQQEFSLHNRFNDALIPNGHILGQYTKSLIPPGKSMFNVPITEDHTADVVAKEVLPIYSAGNDVQLGMEDGLYESDSASDKELVGLQYDAHFLCPSYTDAFMTFYNKVADRLMKAAPDSKARIGFLVYSNMTLPPLRVTHAAKPLVAYLAPIDYDPIHGLDDPHSASAREYRDVMHKWAKVMEGRMVIYDYDQNMLVWRDIPDPSHVAAASAIRHYRDAGILGVDTESRGAMATTFTNLFFRGQLLWNPDADVNALLTEFYPKFYGPAATPMQAYWSAIYKAWNDTLVSEHEYFVAPAIYTPELMAELRKDLMDAETIMKTLEAKPASELDRNSKLYIERVKFTRAGFEVLDAYMAMVKAGAGDADYAAAVAAGEKGLAARDRLTDMNGTFTTYRRIGESGPAWWPGEVDQYKSLLARIDGTKGTLVARTVLTWAFRTDTDDRGGKENWGKLGPDKDWQTLRTDIYTQGQGILTKDYASYTGHLWYSTTIELDAAQVDGKVHLLFPGIFNECWLYVNGEEVAHRPFKGVWWMNDYAFEWDADLAGKLKAGKNVLTIRMDNPHHFGGMFRRPILYRTK